MEANEQNPTHIRHRLMYSGHVAGNGVHGMHGNGHGNGNGHANGNGNGNGHPNGNGKGHSNGNGHGYTIGNGNGHGPEYLEFLEPAASAPTLAPTPRVIARAMARHWKKCTLFFVLTLVVTGMALVSAPRTYSSQAKLFVRVGRESVSLDPTATTGETVPLYHDHDYELNSIVELLQSRGLFEQVVDRVGAQQILFPAPWGTAQAPSESTAWLRRVRLAAEDGVGAAIDWVRRLDPISDRERAIHLLQKSVTVRVPKRSNVASIECRAKTPQLAHDIVAALVDVYQQEHLRVNRTAGAYEFFTQQTSLLQSQLAQTSTALSDAKNELGLLSVESQQQILHQQLAANGQGCMEAEVSLAAARGRIAGLDAALAAIEQRIATEHITGFDNSGADLMRRELYDLELREAMLRALYKEDDPRVVAVREQLADARRVYEQQPTDRAHSTTTINPTYQQLQVERLTEQARAESLQAELAELARQKDELTRRREALNQHTVRLAALQRDVDALEANYRLHAEHLEQSRINHALEEDRISNVNVAQRATFVTKPVSPDKLLVILAGLAVAFFGAALLPFCFEPLGGASESRRLAVAATRSPSVESHESNGTGVPQPAEPAPTVEDPVLV